MIGNDDGGGKEKMRGSCGRSFQIRGEVMDMSRLENPLYKILGIDGYGHK